MAWTGGAGGYLGSGPKHGPLGVPVVQVAQQRGEDRPLGNALHLRVRGPPRRPERHVDHVREQVRLDQSQHLRRSYLRVQHAVREDGFLVALRQAFGHVLEVRVLRAHEAHGLGHHPFEAGHKVRHRVFVHSELFFLLLFSLVFLALLLRCGAAVATAPAAATPSAAAAACDVVVLHHLVIHVAARRPPAPPRPARRTVLHRQQAAHEVVQSRRVHVVVALLQVLRRHVVPLRRRRRRRRGRALR